MPCGRKLGPYDCCSVVQADCLEAMRALPDGCVDAVITDPPYSKEALGLYRELAARSKAVLKLGGLMAAMCGHSYLPELYKMLGESLDYHWTMAYLTPGAQAAQIW